MVVFLQTCLIKVSPGIVLFCAILSKTALSNWIILLVSGFVIAFSNSGSVKFEPKLIDLTISFDSSSMYRDMSSSGSRIITLRKLNISWTMAPEKARWNSCLLP